MASASLFARDRPRARGDCLIVRDEHYTPFQGPASDSPPREVIVFMTARVHGELLNS